MQNKNKKLFILLLGVLFLWVSQVNGQSTIAKWDFEDETKRNEVTTEENISFYTPDEGEGLIELAANLSTWVAGAGGGSAANSNGWNDGADTKYWVVTISTKGYKNITVSSKQSGSNTGPRDFTLQYYSVDLATWEDVLGGVITVANNWTSAIVTEIELPEVCNDLDELKIRWLMTSNISVRAGTGEFEEDDPVLSVGTNRIDDIIITGNSTEADILSFEIGNQVGVSVISDVAPWTIDVVMPYGTDVTDLIPTITISEGAVIAPVSGVTQNFTDPVVYTVTAEDGVTEKEWTVTVTIEDPNDQADILSFEIGNQVGESVFSEVEPWTIDVLMPYGTDVTGLIPTITISEGAEIVPESEVTQDFTDPVVYTVTAEDGVTEKEWTVTVTVKDEVICPDDMSVCIDAEEFGLTGATPEGGVYSGTGVSEGMFDPGTAEAGIHTITYTYEEIECTFTITVNDLPEVTCPEDFTITANEVVTLEGIGENPEGGEFSGEGVSEGVFNPDGLENVNYTITYTYTDPETGCENYCEFIITVDIDLNIESQTTSGLSIYPNPSNGMFVINFNDIKGEVNYQIYDTKGSIIISDKFVNYENSQKEINIDVPAGIYFIRLVNTEKTIVEKIIIK